MKCLYCYGQGELIIEQTEEGFKLTEPCIFCKGKGKLNIVKYLFYNWLEKQCDKSRKHYSEYHNRKHISS